MDLKYTASVWICSPVNRYWSIFHYVYECIFAVTRFVVKFWLTWFTAVVVGGEVQVSGTKYNECKQGSLVHSSVLPLNMCHAIQRCFYTSRTHTTIRHIMEYDTWNDNYWLKHCFSAAVQSFSICHTMRGKTLQSPKTSCGMGLYGTYSGTTYHALTDTWQKGTVVGKAHIIFAVYGNNKYSGERDASRDLSEEMNCVVPFVLELYPLNVPWSIQRTSSISIFTIGAGLYLFPSNGWCYLAQ